MKQLRDCLVNHAGGRVLDVATGRGEFVNRLLDDLEEYTEIIAIDTSERFLSMAREQFSQENIYFLLMDAGKLDFASDSFDTVCISNSLHHLVDPGCTLAEMVRVLKPGGLLVVSEMYQDNQSETQLSHVFLHHWAAKIDRLLGETHNETYTRQEMVEMVQKLNLQQVEYADVYDPDDDPKNPEGIQSVLTALERSIQRVKDFAEFAALQSEAAQIKARIEEIGITGCTQLIITGRKGCITISGS